MSSLTEQGPVTFPIVLIWSSKSGQVWFSIAEDTSPQLVIENPTSHPMFYTQSSTLYNSNKMQNFPQYLLLPPYSKGHFTFPDAYNRFPEIQQSSNHLSGIVFAKAPKLFDETDSDKNDLERSNSDHCISGFENGPVTVYEDEIFSSRRYPIFRPDSACEKPSSTLCESDYSTLNIPQETMIYDGMIFLV